MSGPPADAWLVPDVSAPLIALSTVDRLLDRHGRGLSRSLSTAVAPSMIIIPPVMALCAVITASRSARPTSTACWASAVEALVQPARR